MLIDIHIFIMSCSIFIVFGSTPNKDIKEWGGIHNNIHVVTLTSLFVAYTAIKYYAC